MLNAIIESSLNNRFLVLMGTLLVAGVGVHSALHLPIDAVPGPDERPGAGDHRGARAQPAGGRDAPLVPGRGGDERAAERRADPLDLEVRHLGGDDRLQGGDRHLPGRGSSSASGCPRAAEAIPPGYGTPTLGPITTALGEVFQFQVKATKESGITPMELRTILDWFVAYQFRGVAGVTEINSHGGELKTYQVELDPDKLATYQLSMTDVFNALQVEQRQRRRRLSRPRRRGALHPRREPGTQRRATSRRSSSTSGTACRSRSPTWPRSTPRR